MKTLVLGLGNPILSDDGVGIKVAREIRKQLADSEVVVAETSSDGLDLLELIQGYDRVIIIDAIQTKEGRVGEVYRLELDDLAFAKHLSSPHGVNLPTALELGAMLGIAIPPKITAFAIEVENVTSFSERCTPDVERAIPVCVQTVLGELSGKQGTQSS